jgi:flagellar M-ring protein FliF
MERELQRTIESLDVVAAARVHLVMPEETLFVTEPREAKASVVLKLRGGRPPGGAEITSITHLVASAVDGLDPRRVSVIDAEGVLLSNGSEDEEQTVLSTRQMERKSEVERSLENKVVHLLEPVVGKGRVRARADVDLDFQQVSTTEEIYDPTATAVRTEQKSKQKSSLGNVAGPAGTASNLPTGEGGAAYGPGGIEESSDVTTSFEINRTVRNVVAPAGGVRRLSLAVVVDHAVNTGTGEDGETIRQTTPRSEEEMTKITELVKAGCGFDDARGDTLTVQNIPFEALEFEATEATPLADPSKRHFWLQLVKWPSVVLTALLIFFLAVRPALKSLRQAVTVAAQPATGMPALTGPLTTKQLEEGLAPPRPSETLRRRLIALAAEEPEGIAQVTKAWISEGRPST